MQPGYRPTAGERWSINVPAVIGVAFVVMIGVVVWVVASSGDDDGAAPAPASTTTTATVQDTDAGADTADTTTPPTTSPSPLPSLPTTTPETTAPPTVSSTTPPTSVPSTTVAPTTAPGASDGAVPGDLAVPGRPMQRPPCNGAFITVLASPVGAQATGQSVAAVLDEYPGSNYLRTDQTCRSLRADVDGEPIYVVYLGPFAVDSDACQARAEGPEGAYARQLSDEVGPDHAVTCP